MNIQVTIAILFPIILIVGALWARNAEKKEWNGGICAKTGKPWVRFDTSSQGCRGYKDGEGNFCWITYNVDVIQV